MQVSSVLVALLALVLYWCWFSAINGQAAGCDVKMFDFEISSETSCFRTSGPISVTQSPRQYKHGSHSLKVTVTDSQISSPELRLTTSIQRRQLKRGGLKLWLYRETKRNEVMTVKFENTQNNSPVSKFDVSLDFTGWRGIWVSYKECRIESDIFEQSNIRVGAIILDFPVGSDIVFIDLFEIVDNMKKQTRDKIVPPFTSFEPLYDTSDFWQQTYKWSQERPPKSPAFQASKIHELRAIETKLHNWYADETKATYELGGYKKERWDSLLEDISASHVEYLNLIKVDGIIKGPPLFSRNSKYGTTNDGLKFGHIFRKVLLPLSLEYFLRTRDVEIRYIVGKLSGSLSSTDLTTKEDVIRLIAGNDPTMQNILRSSYIQTSDVNASLDALNDARLQKIFDIHDYLEDQGWADGSAVGSLDHEMNKNGAGFVHSVYLLKTALQKDPTRLERIIRTTKWYTDFGEIYQSRFEFAGSTADRIKALLLYRLLVIMMMPDEAEKIRDIQAFKRWMNNALKINKAMGGLIKPDFTAFHHKGFYPSAYVSHALHTASLVYHLLSESSYQMSPNSVNNLKGALQTLNVVAVKYSMPVSVGGRYPNYTRTSFLSIIPAYAYMSGSYTGDLYSVDPNEAGTFGRLGGSGDTAVDEFMGKGQILSGSFYMNSIGSLDIMNRVKDTSGRAISAPPNGNWAKNFAALSIHRRDLWQVSVKGFNNYVWDFERSTAKSANIFGLFQSHGALQISNNQASLNSQNTSAGWKWMKVPGTTSIDLTLDEMKTSGDRFFNPRPLAGGLTFMGSSYLANGLFGMDFSQPAYKKRMLKKIDFKFKKSVFFFENLLVCVGSGISVLDPSKGDRKSLTTLFQNIQADPPATSIKVHGIEKPLGTPFSAPAFTNDTILEDTNGNGFFIPAETASSLKVEISDQTSRDDADEHETSGRYSTAWLEHTQANSHYEYAVIVDSNKHAFNVETLASAQATSNQAYKVLQNSVNAHVVKFLLSPQSGTALTTPVVGYVIFTANPSDLPAGPIEAVSKPCLLMVEESNDDIKISVSSPDLAFTTKKMKNAEDISVDGLYNFRSRKLTVKVTFTHQEGTIGLKTDGSSWHGGVQSDGPPDVEVRSRRLRNGKFRNVALFNDLTNGFSVEAHFEKLDFSSEV